MGGQSKTIRRAASQRINGITHILCRSTTEETISSAISQWINEITHRLWVVSKTISHQTNEMKHHLWDRLIPNHKIRLSILSLAELSGTASERTSHIMSRSLIVWDSSLTLSHYFNFEFFEFLSFPAHPKCFMHSSLIGIRMAL